MRMKMKMGLTLRERRRRRRKRRRSIVIDEARGMPNVTLDQRDGVSLIWWRCIVTC